MIKTEWNFSLFYKNAKDPNIAKDFAVYEKACEVFETTYKTNTDYVSDPHKLLVAIQAYEQLVSMPEAYRAYMYFRFRLDKNSQDKEAEQLFKTYTEKVTKAQNKLLFFTLTIGKIPKETQQIFLKHRDLSHYQYFLEYNFITAAHDLSEPEEKIINLKSAPAREMWTNYHQKLLGKQTVLWKGKQLPLPAAAALIQSLPLKERHRLHGLYIAKLKEISDFAEAEINAVYTDKKINDELRQHAHPYSRTILKYQNDEKAVLNLVETVSKYNHISHQFYNLKARLLGLKKLTYADRGVSIGKTTKKINFKQASEILKKVFQKLDPQYSYILEDFLNKGHIDVYPKTGKRGGAYCWGNIGLPTLVFLNYDNSFKDVSTFAHEMGHAIHTELSKRQTPLYQSYSTATAEVASTLFENFVFEETFKLLNEKEQAIALHDAIQSDISTIFRQIACFKFELALHNLLRAQGSVSKEEIAELLNKEMKAYLGPKVSLTKDDGYFFVDWGHIRRFFYVYSYAYGQLTSNALHEKYKADPAFLTKIEEFLSAGGSKTPDTIFKDIGVDTTNPKFFEQGLTNIEQKIIQLEQLAKKQNML